MPVSVTRARAVANGIRCRCPNCGLRTLFEPGRMFKVNPVCPNCGLKIEKGDGAFLGPFVINYGITAFGIVIPIILLYAFHGLGATATLALAPGGDAGGAAPPLPPLLGLVAGALLFLPCPTTFRATSKAGGRTTSNPRT